MNADKNKKRIFIGLLALGLALLIYFIVTSSDSKSKGGSDEDNGSFFPIWLIPIWVAIFAPAIANKDKQGRQPLTKEKKMLAILVGLLAGAVLAILLLFLL